MKKALLTFGSMVFSLLAIIFFALPTVQSVLANEPVGDPVSAFDFFDVGQDFFKAMLIMTAIFACLVALFGIFKLLTDSKVVKSKTLAKVVNIIFAVSTVALLVCAIIYMVSVIVMCGDMSASYGGYTVGNIPVVWNIFLVPVFALLSMILGLVSLKKSKK